MGIDCYCNRHPNWIVYHAQMVTDICLQDKYQLVDIWDVRYFGPWGSLCLPLAGRVGGQQREILLKR